MLTGIQVVLMGGDARQIEVIRMLSEQDATVRLIGFDNLHNHDSGVTKQECDADMLIDADALILPAVGTDDEGIVESVFSAERLELTAKHLSKLPKHAKVYTGMGKPYLKQLCAAADVELVELFDLNDVAIYNSIPTAEGAIMLAIQHTDITIHDANCLVLGLGRTGLTVARLLKAMGAHVRAGVYKAEQFARSFEMGLNPFCTQDLTSKVSDADLIFNTIPSMIITAQVIAQIPHRAVIIDLASRPGGTDFRFAEKRGVKALLAPGLPGMVAPKSAGKIIARSLSRLILEDARKRGNAE